jgi:hypothetical protein
MCKNHKLTQKTTIWTSLIERLFGKKTEQKKIDRLPIPTLPPRDRLVLDADRRYRHKGVDGWKFQGYALDGKVLLTTDVYKHIDLQELRTLNKELAEDAEPRIGTPYQIRRSSGSFEKFLFQGINPANQKLMMVKPEGHTVWVSEEELAQENSGFIGHRYKAAY